MHYFRRSSCFSSSLRKSRQGPVSASRQDWAVSISLNYWKVVSKFKTLKIRKCHIMSYCVIKDLVEKRKSKIIYLTPSHNELKAENISRMVKSSVWGMNRACTIITRADFLDNCKISILSQTHRSFAGVFVILIVMSKQLVRIEPQQKALWAMWIISSNMKSLFRKNRVGFRKHNAYKTQPQIMYTETENQRTKNAHCQ